MVLKARSRIPSPPHNTVQTNSLQPGQIRRVVRPRAIIGVLAPLRAQVLDAPHHLLIGLSVAPRMDMVCSFRSTRRTMVISRQMSKFSSNPRMLKLSFHRRVVSSSPSKVQLVPVRFLQLTHVVFFNQKVMKLSKLRLPRSSENTALSMSRFAVMLSTCHLHSASTL